MRRITIDSKVIEFDGPINFIINGPIDNTEMSYSIPFLMPLNNTNRIIFSKNKKQYASKIEFSLLIIEAIFVTEPSPEGYIKGSFVINHSFYALAKSKSLQEIDWGGNINMGANTSEFYDKIIQGLDIESPLHDERFAFPALYNVNITDNWPEVIPSPNFNISDASEDNPGNALRLYTPFIYLHYILKNIVSQSGYKLKHDSFGNDSDLKKIMLYNNLTLADNLKFIYNIPEWNTLERRITNVYTENGQIFITTLTPTQHYPTHPFFILQNTGTIFDNVVIQYSDEMEDSFSLKSLGASFTENIQMSRILYRVKEITPFELETESGTRTIYEYQVDGNIFVDNLDVDVQEIGGSTSTHSAVFKVFKNGEYVFMANIYKTEDDVFIIITDEWLSTPNATWNIHFELLVPSYNYYGKVKFDVNISSSLNSINISKHVPNMNIADFLEHIENSFALFYFPAPFNREISIKFFTDIMQSIPIDLTQFASPIIEKNNNKPRNFIVKYGNDDSDKWWSENIKERFIFENKNYEFIGTVNYPQELGNFQNAKNNNLAKSLYTNSFYVYRKKLLENTGDWIFLSYDLQDMRTEVGYDETEEHTTTILPIFSDSESDSLIVKIANPCNCSAIPELTNKYNLRTFFYNGLLNKIVRTNHRSENISLKMSDNDSIYNQYLQPFYYWKSILKKEEKAIINYPLSTLLTLDLSRKIKLENKEYIIKQIPFTMHMDRIEFSESTLFRV